MCFGDAQTTKTTTAQVDPAVRAAATGNIDFVQNLRDQGFTPYGGQQVANFSPQQQQSFGMVGGIAGDQTAPRADQMISNYAGAPAQSVQANSIASQMSPYMNQYVMQALAPQLQQFDMQAAKTRAATDATATGSGAFGDARTGIEQSQNAFLNNVSRQGLIGNAYNQAFNTAIQAGGQDVTNQMNAQNLTGQFGEQALQRSLGGAQALEGLQNQQLGVAGAVNQMGQQQTAQNQANLTSQYNQWLMSQQYPFQTAQLMNQTTGMGASALPAGQTSVESKPDNSGLSLLGGLGGALLGNSGFGSALGGALFGGGGSALSALAPLAMLSDVRAKDDIDEIGKLNDDTPVYSYRYTFDPEGVKRIGVMAQDVEKRRPDAVVELWPGGLKAVDYAKATELSRRMAGAV